MSEYLESHLTRQLLEAKKHPFEQKSRQRIVLRPVVAEMQVNEDKLKTKRERLKRCSDYNIRSDRFIGVLIARTAYTKSSSSPKRQRLRNTERDRSLDNV